MGYGARDSALERPVGRGRAGGRPRQADGLRALCAASARRGRYYVGGAVNTYDWSDPLRPARNATSFGYLVAPEFVPVDLARMRLEWSHDMSALAGHRFRVLGIVQLRVRP